MELNELKEARGRLIGQGRELVERAEKENRNLSADEQANYDKYLKDAADLKVRIERGERQKELDREVATQEMRHAPRGSDSPEVGDALRTEYRGLAMRALCARTFYADGVRTRLDSLSIREHERLAVLEAQMRSQPYYEAWMKRAFLGAESLTPQELRDLSMGADAAGGWATAPEQFYARLLRKVDDLTFIRQRATKQVVVKAQDLGVPTLEDNPADSDWTSELATGTADTTMDFGKRSFVPKPLAKRMLVSRKLIRASALPIDEIVIDRIGYKYAITEEKGFLTGSGAQQPLGLFTASSSGISIARDISTGNTTTAIGADGLINCKYNLKAPYRRNAEWLFSRAAVSAISQLKDGDGQYLWRPGLIGNVPDQLLGHPISESEYVPATFTTGLYVGLFGDLSYYWIVDALEMTVQRLVELYAATNEDGFIFRSEVDGMPVFEEAFSRLALA